MYPRTFLTFVPIHAFVQIMNSINGFVSISRQNQFGHSVICFIQGISLPKLWVIEDSNDGNGWMQLGNGSISGNSNSPNREEPPSSTTNATSDNSQTRPGMHTAPSLYSGSSLHSNIWDSSSGEVSSSRPRDG
jgi:hypothetical protein